MHQMGYLITRNGYDYHERDAERGFSHDIIAL